MEPGVRLIPTDDLHYKWERHGETLDPDSYLSMVVLGSVAERGIVNPLLVARAEDGKLYVYIGNQRLAAARKLEIGQVPCRFVNSGEEVSSAMAEYHDT